MAEVAPIRDFTAAGDSKIARGRPESDVTVVAPLPLPPLDVSSSRTQPGATAAWSWRRGPPKRDTPGGPVQVHHGGEAPPQERAAHQLT